MRYCVSVRTFLDVTDRLHELSLGAFDLRWPLRPEKLRDGHETFWNDQGRWTGWNGEQSEMHIYKVDGLKRLKNHVHVLMPQKRKNYWNIRLELIEDFRLFYRLIKYKTICIWKWDHNRYENRGLRILISRLQNYDTRKAK